MDTTRVIGIEGVPTAGKSSLCNEISSRYEICPEFARYAEEMPPYPSNRAELRSQCEHALTCEKKRRNDYNDVSEPLLIMDSSPLATIGYIYITSTILEGDVLREFLQEYIKCIDRDEIFEPDAVVWLRPTYSTVSDRWEQRGRDDFWSNSLVVKALDEMYEQICNYLPSVVIDSTTTPLNEEAEIVHQFVDDLNESTELYQRMYDNRDDVFDPPAELSGRKSLLRSQRTEWPTNS